MEKILVVDDEAAIRDLIQYNLETAGFAVTTADNGVTACQLAENETFACIVLDLMLPKRSGVEVTKYLRLREIMTPIIMLTARHEEADKIIGLELGADDYMTKPFSPRELVARIKAIRRRVQEPPTLAKNVQVTFGPITWQMNETFLRQGKRELPLTRKEFELLTFLVQNRQKVISRQQIILEVWQSHEPIMSRMVDMQVSHLRDKIEPDPKHPQFLLTARGFGYRLEVSSYEKQA
ncbi:response regulator transcription factor [Lapidilactobacillus gannanensis]|jgi:two-component system alkaline phosphatase synthesis response regulator PhoP|uniref:Response regulator transcription factor n=1 Tax=Lapidilactobacillus gannanensis TaxID=2486002 RepID=A0ABW4BRQ4_9LACO|nr:response regulator transcription factor [Lapidilactobacillus gannanensis]MCH4056622.1 response regulator transcription factor [Lactobacillaceae bacterium]